MEESSTSPRTYRSAYLGIFREVMAGILRRQMVEPLGRDKLRFLTMTLLIAALAIVAMVSLSIGAVAIDLKQVLAIILHSAGIDFWQGRGASFDQSQQAVLTSIRAPRIMLCIVVGAGLAVAGATLQGLFRNPLADPSLIGVSSGAALAAVSVIVLGGPLLNGFEQLIGQSVLPIAAFVGGVIATLIVFQLGTRNGYTSASIVLLAGIAINAIAGAGIGLLMYLADDEQLRTLTFWTMGSFGGTTWESFFAATPWIVLATIYISFHANALNALLLGEAEAGHLGFDLQSLKRRLIISTALAVGAAVAVTGIIGFVGLVVPHLLRLVTGPDYRILLPGSAILGAILLMAADLAARTIVVPAELPIGIVTAVLGGPFFLWLLMRRNLRIEN